MAEIKDTCEVCGVVVGAMYIANQGSALCFACREAGLVWAARMAAKRKEPVGGLPACDCDAEFRKGSCFGVHRNSCAMVKELKSRRRVSIQETGIDPGRTVTDQPPTELKADTPMVRNPDGKYREAKDGEMADAFVSKDTLLTGDPEQRIEAVERGTVGQFRSKAPKSMIAVSEPERCCQAPEGFHQPSCLRAEHYPDDSPATSCGLSWRRTVRVSSVERVTCVACALSLHLPTCGTEHRGCDPKCPKDRLEKAMPEVLMPEPTREWLDLMEAKVARQNAEDPRPKVLHLRYPGTIKPRSWCGKVDAVNAPGKDLSGMVTEFRDLANCPECFLAEHDGRSPPTTHLAVGVGSLFWCGKQVGLFTKDRKLCNCQTCLDTERRVIGQKNERPMLSTDGKGYRLWLGEAGDQDMANPANWSQTFASVKEAADWFVDHGFKKLAARKIGPADGSVVTNNWGPSPLRESYAEVRQQCVEYEERVRKLVHQAWNAESAKMTDEIERSLGVPKELLGEEKASKQVQQAIEEATEQLGKVAAAGEADSPIIADNPYVTFARKLEDGK